jgi:predicted RNA methylase
MCSIKDYASIELDPYHLALVLKELEMWHVQYLPCGRRVLDVGAGCGETALFYLKHGAEQVVCIEGDPKVLGILHRNFDKDPRVTIVPLMLDHIKVDVDGAEEGMLVETHFPHELRHLWRDGDSETRLWRLSRRSRHI